MSREVWWCEEHESGSIHDYGRCEWMLFAEAEGTGSKLEPCRMVRGALDIIAATSVEGVSR